MFLNCHTAFSFKYGTLTVKDLFNEARRCGVHKLIITEINNTASYIEMLRLCAENKIYKNGKTKYDKEPYDLSIAVGIEFRKGHELLYLAIAKNNTGFEEINRFLSHHNEEDKPLPHRAPEFEQAFVIYPFKKVAPEFLRENEFIGIRHEELTQFSFSSLLHEYPTKFIALHPVTFANKIDFNTHRLLRAIDCNTLLSKLPAHEQASPNEIMIPEAELEELYSNFPSVIKQTKAILNQCTLDFTLGEDKNKKIITENGATDWDLLTRKTWEGFKKIYPGNISELRQRVDRELTIIKKKNFCAYYLITYDLICYAKSQGFDYVGRGSGANSVVAYCLGITNVDPIELDLYFERFLNEERTSPPDFDIDFSWDNRDAIYNYLFEQHGKEHVCLLGTHVTYQRNSVLRELAKVFGLPKSEIDSIVDYPHAHQHRDNITQLIFRYAERIKDLPANISIHAGGVLITEKSIYAYTATELPPKGYPVSHFEMHNAEDFGIYKFDILSQRGLGHIKESAKHIKRNTGNDVNVHDFKRFKEDEKIKDLMRTGKTMGCFYVESPATRMLLGKLRCEDYLTLVAASSIIRPGVASSGMMKAYIERYHMHRRGVSYKSIHPKMDALMADTFGVMVYQEDVIKVAHHFANLTLTQADVLRRGMSGKYRSREEFQRVHDIFFENCETLGYGAVVTNEVWNQIESFAGYSFAKGHSASYAVESYQSLFLKAHYPLEFMVGVINNFGGFYKTEFYFHEARVDGAIIEAPCINHSEYLTTIYGNHIFIGLIHLKSLETKAAKRVVDERLSKGLYTSFNNFLKRNTIGLEQVRILIRIGAFRFTQKTKQRLLWEAMLYFSESKKYDKTSIDLFDEEPTEFLLPELKRTDIEDAFDEMELLGFPLCDPFELVSTDDFGNSTASILKEKLGKSVSILGYVITTKNTRTKKGELMHFGTFYDQHGEVFDTVHFPDAVKKFPFRGRGFYFMKGKVVEDFGVYMIEVHWMDKIPLINKKEFPEEHFTMNN
jgi:DNA-directed DNA polymerase III PolC